MKLTGTYTAAGAELAAKIQAGLCGLSITRVAAASGPTSDDAAALASERQILPILRAVQAGAAFTVTAQLVSAAADTAYTLNEIGLYAKGETGDILYRLYRMDEPLSINPQSSLTAEFSLTESVIAGAKAEASVSPAGLLNEAAGRSLTEEYFLYSGEPLSISCTGAQLSGVLGRLPRPVNRDIKITVTDSVIPGALILRNLVGAGSLTIRAAAEATVADYILAEHCHLGELVLENLKAAGGAAYKISDAVSGISSPSCIAAVRCSDRVIFRRCSVPAPAVKSTIMGFYFYRSDGALYGWSAPNRLAAACANHMTTLGMFDSISAGASGCSYAGYLSDGCCVRTNWDVGSKQGAEFAFYCTGGCHVDYNNSQYGN